MVPLSYSVECESDQFSPSHISIIKAESSVFSKGFLWGIFLSEHSIIETIKDDNIFYIYQATDESTLIKTYFHNYFFKLHFQVHSIVTKLTEAVMTSENYFTMTLWTIFDKQILSRKLIGAKKWCSH